MIHRLVHAIVLSILMVASGVGGAEPPKRPVKIWDLTGPLGETPNAVTDALPLSDQQNKGGWVKFEPMSDEFEGKELDRNKWVVGLEGWKGRQPALFSDKNVTVSDGKLHLTMRKEKLPPEAEKQGYKDYTSAALHTNARTAYGYFRGQGQADELGRFKFVLVSQGRHARLADGDRRVRDRRQGQGL